MPLSSKSNSLKERGVFNDKNKYNAGTKITIMTPNVASKAIWFFLTHITIEIKGHLPCMRLICGLLC